MERCPITKQPCEAGEENPCPFWIKLTDYEGCPFDLADKAIQDFKKNTVLPAVRKLDELVNLYLKGGK